MRKEYYIPMVEIVRLNTEQMMIASTNSGSHSSVGQAPARFAPVPDGGVKSF